MGSHISAPYLAVDAYQVYDESVNLVTHTGDLIETTLKSYLIPRRTIGINGGLRIKASGQYFATQDLVTFRLKLGGVIIAQPIMLLADENWTLFAALHNNAAEDAQRWESRFLREGGCTWHQASHATALDTGNDQLLSLTAQLADADDEVSITEWTVEIRHKT